MEDIKILKESLPVIQINFDEMKIALVETLKDYKGIVVTEESLSSCKATQKELASVRVKIDAYRKDKKKILSKPITEFENQCKELINLVEQAEQPIKDGIKVFDDLKRDMKRNQALELIKEVAAEQELNEKYASRLEVLDKYCNLTAKSNEVKDDLTSRAMALKIEQDREVELIEIIKDTIDTENEKINTKLKFTDFQRYIDRGVSTKEILQEIKMQADRVYKAENPPKVEEQPNIPQQEESVPKTNIPPTQKDKNYFAEYRITGQLEQLKSVSKFLKDNGISYTVGKQGEIWENHLFCKVQKNAM